MSQSLFSSLWYRIASIKPRLKSHVSIHRHKYRNQLWFVLYDQLTGKNHRFTPIANHLISKMDGDNTVQSIWQDAVIHFGDEAPTQDETIQLLGQLHGNNVLATDMPPDSLEIFERYSKHKKQTIKQKLMSPMAMRFPLWDPERFLNRFQFLFNAIFGWFGAVLWIAVVGTGIFVGAMHWPELTENIADRALTPQNFILLWFLFPIVKALHELGHGFAVKVWGGEVHEMGIMLLVFIPVPYVDASAASAFVESYKRVIVAAAGMLVELFIAAIALFFWVSVEPGIMRTIAYNVILIASVSTLLFNINPLLKFDGYYMLADMIGIPNLYARASKYLGYLTQKYAFGLKETKSPVSAKGEAKWFVFYAIASFCYRMFIMFAIAIFVAGKFFFIGTLLAIFAVANMVFLPLLKGLFFVFSGKQLRLKRTRAVAITMVVIGVISGLIVFYPVPSWTNVEGVIWMPENAQIRTGADCFAKKILVSSGSHVNVGTPLIQCENSELSTSLALAEKRAAIAKTRLNAAFNRNPVLVELSRDEYNAALAEYNRAKERVEELLIRSRAAGVLVLPVEQDMYSRYFPKGEILGYVLQKKVTRVRTVVTQDHIESVRTNTKSVEVSPIHNRAEVIVARIAREVPGGDMSLPSAALGTAGGGKIVVDPRDPQGLTTFNQVFQFDIELPDEYLWLNYGGRVFVRFNHRKESLGKQWYRSIRQLFLGEFGV